MRGILTQEIKDYAQQYLHREFTQQELRLYPFIDYTSKNGGFMKAESLAREEITILNTLEEEKHIKFRKAHTGINVIQLGYNIELTKDFYDFVNQILWMSYVAFPITQEED